MSCLINRVGRIEEQPDEQLFMMDTSGDHVVHRRMAAKKKLRIDEILEERSAIPAVRGKHSNYSKSQPKKAPMEKAVAAKILAKKQQQKPKAHIVKAAVPAVHAAMGNIWDDELSKKETVIPIAMPATVDVAYLESILEKPVKKPETMVKPKIAEVVPAVQVAHPGASYNPVGFLFFIQDFKIHYNTYLIEKSWSLTTRMHSRKPSVKNCTA